MTGHRDLETIAVHAGAEPDPVTGAVAPPIHLSTTYRHAPNGERLFPHLYIRGGSPTEQRLEEAMAAMDGGEGAAVFASGVAAGAAVLATLPAGSRIVFPHDLFANFRRMFLDYGERWGLTATFADLRDPAAIPAAVAPGTRLVWIDSISNPMLNIVDVAAAAEAAHRAGAKLLVDATFATPVLQRPIELGADYVLHSTTKYYGGHSDVQGGAIVVKSREDLTPLLHYREVLGPVASPFNSWLVLRGIRSMPCRVERQAATALAVARALEGHPKIASVLYPGLESHPGYDIARRQMRAPGAVLSLLARGGLEAAAALAGRLKLFTNATSLGGVESLVELRAAIEGPATTTPPNLLRLSIGLESPRDLIDDLLEALR